MRTSLTRSTLAMFVAVGLVLAACGSDAGDVIEEQPAVENETPASADVTGAGEPGGPADVAPADDADAAPTADEVSAEMPTIAVTTVILADVVEEVVGDIAQVVTIMPAGADPHSFQASAGEVDTMMSADAIIANGAAFEEGLLDIIENAADEGIPTFEAISAVSTIEFAEGDHDHHSHDHGDDHDPGDEHDHGDDDHHHHSGTDPHFFTDPMRMADAVVGMVAFLQAELGFADPVALDASVESYVAELTALDGEVMALVDSIPEENRVLVTSHQGFNYFADRYGFEIVGTVIPSGTSSDSASASDIAELADAIRAEGVPAVFSDSTASDELLRVLVTEVGGDVEVVELFSESLGEPGSGAETYLTMQATNAERMYAALS